MREEDRVRGVQRLGLQPPQIELASPRHADLAGGICQPEQAEHLEAVPRIHPPTPLERGPVDGMQEVDRNRLGGQGPQLERHRHHVVVPFAQPHNPPRADFHPGLAHHLQRLQPVVERVGAADLVVMLAAGVEVVVHPVDSGVGELPGLVGAEQPEAAADIQGEFRLDLADHPREVLHLAIGGTASRRDNAEGPRLGRRGGPGVGEQRRLVVHAVDRNVGGRDL